MLITLPNVEDLPRIFQEVSSYLSLSSKIGDSNSSKAELFHKLMNNSACYHYYYSTDAAIAVLPFIQQIAKHYIENYNAGNFKKVTLAIKLERSNPKTMRQKLRYAMRYIADHAQVEYKDFFSLLCEMVGFKKQISLTGGVNLIIILNIFDPRDHDKEMTKLTAFTTLIKSLQSPNEQQCYFWLLKVVNEYSLADDEILITVLTDAVADRVTAVLDKLGIPYIKKDKLIHIIKPELPPRLDDVFRVVSTAIANNAIVLDNIIETEDVVEDEEEETTA